jgi:peptidase E
MGQIIAMGGGDFSMEPDNSLLDEYVLAQSRRALDTEYLGARSRRAR